MSNESNEIVILNQLPLWYIKNIHIKEGYRKPNTNIIFTETLFTLHNELFNIWINLISIIGFLVLSVLLYFDTLNKLNKMMLGLYLLVLIFHQLARLNYYIYSPNNEITYYNLIKLYYTSNITFCFISLALVIYCLFYQYIGIKYSYILLLFLLLTLVFNLFDDNRIYDLHKRAYRSTIFTLYISLIFIPLLHYGFIISFTDFYYIFILIIIITIIILYSIGLIVYKNCFPEQFYTIKLIGSSDNICNIMFHCGCMILYLSMRYIMYCIEK